MKNNHDQIDIGAAIDVVGLGKFQIRNIKL